MEIEEIIQLSDDQSMDTKVVNVNIDRISTNPFQPRKKFDEESLCELADSILEFGVLQPLLVLPLENNEYLLIAGERRLRASKKANLTKVPVIVGNYSNQQVAEIAMIENLQREDLHYLDEAEGYQLIMREFNITQDELAKRVGKKQSTIANKLRILKLDKNIREVLQEKNLTERHARALLKIENVNEQLAVLNTAVKEEMNVKQTEEYIKNFLNPNNRELLDSDVQKTAKHGKHTRIIRDVRIFINTINKVVTDVRKTGVTIDMKQENTEDEIVITMRVPLNKATKK